MKFHETLENLGLSKSEAKLYLESLALGPASAIQLAQKIGVTRQSIYELLPSLIEKGLVKQARIGSKKLFQAVSPDVLRDRTQQIAQQIEEMIPQLKSKQAEHNALPTISVYENPLAMREWYQRTMEDMKKGEEMLIWSSGTLWIGLDGDFYALFAREKSRKGVVDKVLAPNTSESRKVAQQLAAPHREYRFLKEWWQSPAEMWIWRNQCVFLTIKENATNLTVIESEPLSTLERFKFEQAWQVSA